MRPVAQLWEQLYPQMCAVSTYKALLGMSASIGHSGDNGPNHARLTGRALPLCFATARAAGPLINVDNGLDAACGAVGAAVPSEVRGVSKLTSTSTSTWLRLIRGSFESISLASRVYKVVKSESPLLNLGVLGHQLEEPIWSKILKKQLKQLSGAKISRGAPNPLAPSRGSPLRGSHLWFPSNHEA